MSATATPPAVRELTSNGRACSTPYTDGEALAICERVPAYLSCYSFAQDLIRSARTRGLTPNQVFWVHKLALEQVEREAKAAEADAARAEAEEAAKYGDEPPPSKFDNFPAGKLPRIAAFLAAGAQKGPMGARLVIERGDVTITFKSTTKDRTRWPGGFLVVGVFGFERRNVPLARIDAAGNLFFSDDGRLVSDIHAMLEMFEESPLHFVLTHRGKRNWCCFCKRDLTDPISVAVGYGPICAGNYGLPHDHETAAQIRAAQTAEGQESPDVAG